MSLQHDVSEILANLAEERPDKWGQQAGRIAEGIRGSGLAEAVTGAVADSALRIEAELAALGSLLGVAAGSITAEIGKSNIFLAGIDDTLRNPQATAADERYRRGMTALKRMWTDDAINELRASIEANPYFAPAHAYLGIALSAEGRDDQAIEAFQRATKYATPDEPQIATGCTLLSASKLEKLGRIDAAVIVLAAQIAVYPTCPELRLTWSRLSKNSAGVEAALWMAPELATAAVAAGVPDADVIAERLAVSPDGPVAQLREFTDAYDVVSRASYLTEGLFHEEVRHVDASDTPEALRVAGAVFSHAAGSVDPLRRAIEAARYKDLQIDASSETTSGEKAEADWQLDRATTGSGLWGVLLVVGIGIPVGIVITGWVGQASEPTAIGIGVVFTVIGIVVGIFTVGFTGSNFLEHLQAARRARTRLGSVAKQRSEIVHKKSAAEIAQRAAGLATVEEITAMRGDRVRPWVA